MLLTSEISVKWLQTPNSVMERAFRRFLRDISMTLENRKGKNSTAVCRIIMEIEQGKNPESYRISVKEQTIHIVGADELGIIYALLFLSEEFLGIAPFWYWNDQEFVQKPSVSLPDGEYLSPQYKLRFRGWFINDEVLLDAWGKDDYVEESQITENFAFEMAMEALLRLGGNMVIPGTDQNSHKYRKLAADMGLWITHHHAEPLGAQMFARAYPGLTPSYDQHPQLFEGLWRAAIEEQKECKVIWNIGFRGQGDRPFWADDPAYDTPAKRGKLISSLIQRQYSILSEYLENPVCCTNLYGEIMELYQQGYISLPEQVIYIWADNGYGKMVSRRQGSHNPRVEALPVSSEGRHGIYYHASFYDLQAASHITMLPNSTAFVEAELKNAMDRGVRDFLVVNCSNVRPHTYMLDYLARIWGKKETAYTSLYFPQCPVETEQLYQRYFDAMLKYGPNADDHAGEQYYHYTMRAVCHGWLLGRLEEPEKDLVWLTGERRLTEQVEYLERLADAGMERLRQYYTDCDSLAVRLKKTGEEKLFEDSVLLQAQIHYKSLLAQKRMCGAYHDFRMKEWEKAFVGIGCAAEYLHEIISAMKAAGHGKWKGFYDNDCLTDVKFTVYMLEHVMGYIRNLGDGPHFYQWALKYMYPGINNKVVLITNMRNHPTDWELYLAMK